MSSPGAHRVLQADGGSLNATTWSDRTNYFETLPSGGLDLALWLEADRLGSLLDALTQANLDNQREVVKEEQRQRYDNVPYGDALLRLIQLTFPADHPYGHTVIGSMEDLNAASVEDVAPSTRALRAEQRGAVDRGRLRARGRLRQGRALLRFAGGRSDARRPVGRPAAAAQRAAPAGDVGRRPGRCRLPHLAPAGGGHPRLRCRRPGHDGARARSDVPALPPTGSP